MVSQTNLGSSVFSNVVFSGGGSRCFWQAGFWSVYDPDRTRTPTRVVAVSAGSAIACLVFAGRIEFGLRYFKQQTARNRRNFYPARLLTGGAPFPHEQIYRDAINATIDAAAFEALRRGPNIQIAMAAPPRWLGPQTGFLVGALAYDVERRMSHAIHPRLGRALGFRSLLGTTHDCATPTALADLILASSGTPPFTPSATFNGRTVLDGGMFDNVPVHAKDQPGETLVLLSRRYRTLPQIAGRTYVQPSSDIQVSKWDYTNPAGLQHAFDLGRRDAETFLRS